MACTVDYGIKSFGKMYSFYTARSNIALCHIVSKTSPYLILVPRVIRQEKRQGLLEELKLEEESKAGELEKRQNGAELLTGW